MSTKTTYHIDVVEPDGDKLRIDFGAAGTALVSNGPTSAPGFSTPAAFVTQIEDDTDFVNATNTGKKMRIDLSGLPVGTETFVFPASGGTIALTSDISSVFLDTAFRVEDNASGDQLGLELSGLTADRTVTAVDADGALVLQDTGSNLLFSALTPLRFEVGDFELYNTLGDATLVFDLSNIGATDTTTLTAQGQSGTIGYTEAIAGCYAKRQTTNQTLNDGALTTIIFNDDSNTPMNDDGNNFNTSTGVYTAPDNGYYNFSTSIRWTSDPGATLTLYTIRTTSHILAYSSLSVSHLSQSLAALHVRLVTGTTVWVEVTQNTGGTLDVAVESSFGVSKESINFI